MALTELGELKNIRRLKQEQLQIEKSQLAYLSEIHGIISQLAQQQKEKEQKQEQS